MVVDEAGLEKWGRGFAATLRPPVVVGLSGELGAGKTTLVRAIADALGVKQQVTSPTFALVHQYDGDEVRVYHVDAYRLSGEGDVRDLGFADMLADPAAVVLVEWPERLQSRLGAPRLDRMVRLSYAAGGAAREVVES